jgi:hypothetical protein
MEGHHSPRRHNKRRLRARGQPDIYRHNRGAVYSRGVGVRKKAPGDIIPIHVIKPRYIMGIDKKPPAKGGFFIDSGFYGGEVFIIRTGNIRRDGV